MKRKTAVALAIAVSLVSFACKDRGSSGSAQTAKIEQTSVVDVVPVADGGAYAIGSGEGIWYVRGGEAVRVKEVSTLSAATASVGNRQEGWRFALAAYERGRRRQLERSLAEQEPDPGDRDY